MKVQDCMTESVLICRPDTSMEQAAGLMWDHDCGVLPVVDQDRLVGMVTDRDLCMGAYMQGKSLRDLRVEDCMSRQVFACLSEDPLEQAIRIMGDHEVRRVPVVDAAGKLVGILSMNDLVRKIVELADARARASLSSRVVEALSVICESRRSRKDVLEPIPPQARETVRRGAVGARAS